MYIEFFILKSGLHLQGERTISGIYHLLKGKKSIQSIHDARMFQIEKVYGLYPNLHKEFFDKKVKELNKNELISFETNSEEIFRLTNAGKQWLNQHDNIIPYSYFNGLKYSSISPIFYERLLLLIQTLTNSNKKNFSFIPIVDKVAVTSWVKNYYRKTKRDNQTLLHHLYHDISSILQQIKPTEAAIFVDRLTGYKYYGMSIDQLANKYSLEPEDIRLLLVGIIHQMLQRIDNNKDNYRILPLLLTDLSGNHLITNTAKRTKQLLDRNYSIDHIARIRGLKENTIQDHIVEIALYDTDFPIYNYVDKKVEKEIVAAITQLKSFKLREIKHAVHENISYFQIRLVLSQTEYQLK
ncbi:helix-turn-helix domain-containing protein [Ornithinibacillus salinisoli]|uniref:Helix-turn-helix domain-containing protein n=1 Tax=Ornithinibacillus salinisoli TaxID=1848459 RepID=A0ABW4W354_9BACI